MGLLQNLKLLRELIDKKAALARELDLASAPLTTTGEAPPPQPSPTASLHDEDGGYAEAEQLIAAGREDEAVALLRELAGAGALRWDIHNDLGAMLLNRGQYTEAIEALKIAVSLEFSSTHALRNLISAYVVVADYANALAATGLLLRKEGEDPAISGFVCELLLASNPRLDDHAWLSPGLAATLEEYRQLKLEHLNGAPERRANRIKARLYDWLASQPLGMDQARVADPAVGQVDSGNPSAGHCVFCNKENDSWGPYRESETSPFLAGLGVIGSNPDRFWCPCCASHDRERHLLLYLNALDLVPTFAGAAVLHIAPEKHLSRTIEACQPAEYVRGDLDPADDRTTRVDVERMPFDDAHFDWVVCNHVLEHVSDPTRALNELYRVLKSGGRMVCQTPYASKLTDTFESPLLTSAEDRLLYFGQEDHLRLFGGNIAEVICAAGFSGQLRGHDTLLGDIDPVRYGVNELEPFFLFQKPEK